MNIKLPSFIEWRKEHHPEQDQRVFETPSEKSSLHINEWSEEDWCILNGVGPKLASRLVEAGPYDSIEDVKSVKGISKKVIEQITSSSS